MAGAQRNWCVSLGVDISRNLVDVDISRNLVDGAAPEVVGTNRSCVQPSKVCSVFFG
jgi:hypothetical protein